MKTPKFTDRDRFVRPYADAEESKKPGYLKRRFDEIAKRNKANSVEAQDKVMQLRAKP